VPDCAADDFVLLGNVIICRLYKWTISDQTHVSLQLLPLIGGGGEKEVFSTVARIRRWRPWFCELHILLKNKNVYEWILSIDWMILSRQTRSSRRKAGSSATCQSHILRGFPREWTLAFATSVYRYVWRKIWNSLSAGPQNSKSFLAKGLNRPCLLRQDIESIIIITYLLTAIGLSPGGSSPTLVQTKIKIHKTVKLSTQTEHSDTLSQNRVTRSPHTSRDWPKPLLIPSCIAQLADYTCSYQYGWFEPDTRNTRWEGNVQIFVFVFVLCCVYTAVRKYARIIVRSWTGIAY
jgi:hypothetical protein